MCNARYLGFLNIFICWQSPCYSISRYMIIVTRMQYTVPPRSSILFSHEFLALVNRNVHIWKKIHLFLLVCLWSSMSIAFLEYSALSHWFLHLKLHITTLINDVFVYFHSQSQIIPLCCCNDLQSGATFQNRAVF